MPHFIRLVTFTEKGIADPLLSKSRSVEFKKEAENLAIERYGLLLEVLEIKLSS